MQCLTSTMVIVHSGTENIFHHNPQIYNLKGTTLFSSLIQKQDLQRKKEELIKYTLPTLYGKALNNILPTFVGREKT